MHSRFVATVLAFALLFLGSCRGASSSRDKHQVEVDLIERLPYAEKIADTQSIVAGMASGKAALLSGWSALDKNSAGSYVRPIAPKSSFAFHLSAKKPLYLHLRMKGSPNSVEIFLNSHPEGRIVLEDDQDFFTIPLSQKNLSDTNVVTLQFPEESVRNGTSFYHATVSSSKYLVNYLEDFPVPEFWSTDWIYVGNKKEPALISKTGGSILYYEELNRDSKLRFGYYYHPYSLAEEDDFAAFSIYLRRDGQPEKRIFYKRASDPASGFESLDFSKFISDRSPSFYEIEFRTERNTIYDSGQTAWIRPVLVQDRPQEPDYEAYSRQIEKLRKANRDANVIILLLDAASADHFSTYGYFRKTTPVTDQLAREGVQFNSAYCQAVYTLASTGSLMSGLYPFHHHVLYLKNGLSSDIYTMAEAFRDGGYQTGTFVANGNASTAFGMTQGFQKIREVYKDKNYTGWGQDITNSFTNWLDEKPPGKFFAYLHYREPHAPFNPPKQWISKFVDPNYRGTADASFEFRQKVNLNEGQSSKADKDYVISLYDANLNYGDYQVGLVLKKLKQMGIYDNTIVIVTADHGEAFWEHGFQGHNGQLYQESMQIPMVIKLAKNSPITTKNVQHVTRTIDYYPTLVDLMGFSRRYVQVDGRSFVPYFVSAPSDHREAISQTVMERAYAYVWKNYKYIAQIGGPVKEFYNLNDDSLELHNLVKIKTVHAGFYRSRLFGEISESKKVRRWSKAEQAVLDESSRENLRALGYLDE